MYIVEINSLGRDSRVRVLVSRAYPYPVLPSDSQLKLIEATSGKYFINWQRTPSESISTIEYCVSVSRKEHLVSLCRLDEGARDERVYKSADAKESKQKNSKSSAFVSDEPASRSAASSESPQPRKTFSDWWERTKSNLLSQSQQWERSRGFDVHCVGSNVWHEIKTTDWQPGATYFIDVFARNSLSNATTVYDGVNVTSPAATRRPVLQLQDNALTSVALDAKNNFSASLKFSFNQNHLGPEAGLWLFVETCSANPSSSSFASSTAMLVEVRSSPETNREDHLDFDNARGSDSELPGHVLSRSYISDMESIFIKYLSPERDDAIGPGKAIEHLDNNKERKATVTLELTSENSMPRLVNVFISKKYSKFPFARLPADRSLRLFNSLSTCNSVTLSWSASLDEKVRYCVYQRALGDEDASKEIGELLHSSRQAHLCASSQNLGDATGANDIETDNRMPHEKFAPKSGKARDDKSPASRKAICRRYHKFSKRRFNDVIVERLENLEPSTTYIFEVAVQKTKGKAIYYEAIRARTRSAC